MSTGVLGARRVLTGVRGHRLLVGRGAMGWGPWGGGGTIWGECCDAVPPPTPLINSPQTYSSGWGGAGGAAGGSGCWAGEGAAAPPGWGRRWPCCRCSSSPENLGWERGWQRGGGSVCRTPPIKLGDGAAPVLTVVGRLGGRGVSVLRGGLRWRGGGRRGAGDPQQPLVGGQGEQGAAGGHCGLGTGLGGGSVWCPQTLPQEWG